VYSTCSIDPEENTGVVETFLKRQPGFALEGTRMAHPVRDAVDGAYCARLRRNP
jgi:16S rRNA (cytosine967-C5)-methyltransferase